jgi:hypothetical protein
MARTTIPVQALTKNGGVAMATAESATAVDQANGMIIANANPEKTMLRVTNTAGAQHGVIIRAGDQIYPAWMSGQGDLTVQVALTSGVAYVGPFDSARFLQSDGSLHVDFEASFAGKIAAVTLP